MRTREERIARQTELLQLRDAVKPRLMAIPGVRTVDIGLKEVGGRLTDEIVFRVYVDEKKSLSEVPPAERIPERIDGIATDVVPWRPSETTVDSDRYRPLLGGIQITNGQGFGTLGCFARRTSDQAWVALSNQHVMFAGRDAAATDIRLAQPATGCCCCCVTGYVARVVAGSIGGGVDCAIATLDEGVGHIHEVQEVGAVMGTSTVIVGDAVKKRGRTSGLTTGVILSVGFDTSNENGVGFPDQLRVSPDAAFPDFQVGGDSGAALLNAADEVVGLMWGKNGHDGVANAIAEVESALGITVPVADGSTLAFDRLTPAAAAAVNGGRVRDWERLLLDETKAEHPLGILVSRHRAEVWDLIQHNREVGVRWQRTQGPAYVAAFERTTRKVGYRVPSEIGGVSLTELFLAMAVALERNGSAGLRADLRAEAIAWIPRLQRCDTAESLWQEYQMLKHEYEIRKA